MRIKLVLLFLVLSGFLAGFCNCAFAHKVNLFCYFEDGFLKGEGYYSGGRAAQNVKIEVYRLSDNSLIAEAETNDNGEFEIKMDSPGPIKAIMNAGGGHRAEFIMEEEPAAPAAALPGKPQSEPGFIAVAGGIGVIIGIFSLTYFIKKKHAL